MGTVEAAIGPGLWRAGELVDERGIADAGRGAQVARLHAAAGEQVGDLPVAPEERGDQRRTAVAAGERVGARAGVEQHVHEVYGIRVAHLVQGRPAVRVGMGGVGAPIEQQADGALVAGGRRHAQQVVAVGALHPDDIGPTIEHRAQAVWIVGLDGAVGAEERLAASRQAADVAAQRLPAHKAVRSRDHQPGAARRAGRADALECGDRTRRAVLGRGAQPERASLVVVQIVVVGELHAVGVGGETVGVGLHPRPARKTLLPCDRQLRGRELGLGVGAAPLAQALLGALAQLFEVHGSLLPDVPAVRKHRAGGACDVSTANRSGWGTALRADGARTGRASQAYTGPRRSLVVS